MCARRFLMIVFVLTLLVVAAGFAIFEFGQSVLIKGATPKGHYVAPPPSSGPDYSKVENWIARPDLPDDPSRWHPDGVSEAPRGTAAVFYVHPTTYLQRDRWNAPLEGDRDGDFRSNLFVQTQASAFNSVGQVYAPRYRQAAYGAFLLKSDDAQKALDLAYSDVSRAFDEFLKRAGDRPIVLAAHSQGALHLSRLLGDRRAALKGRLIAAYVAGWPLSTAVDLPAMGLAPCSTPDQTGCVLSWQSFGEPANPDLILDAWKGTKGPAGVERRRADMLCVNPLTGTKDGAAPPSANPGTLIPTSDMASAALEPGRVGARCDKGFLIIDGDIPPLGPFVLPGNNYHVYDYALFWGAVRRDAERRAAAWRR